MDTEKSRRELSYTTEENEKKSKNKLSKKKAYKLRQKTQRVKNMLSCIGDDLDSEQISQSMNLADGE